jgi:hypothetical protein
MKKIEATITVSGWGDDKVKAIDNLCDILAGLMIQLKIGANLDTPEDLGVRFDEFDETENYAGKYGECIGCQYRDQMSDEPTCIWNPARDPDGCEVENKKKEG